MINCSGFTQKLSSGADIGTVQTIEVINSAERGSTPVIQEQPDTLGEWSAMVNEEIVTKLAQSIQRKKRLHKLLAQETPLQREDENQLLSVLEDYHDVFSLEEGERGETDWVEMKIDTGDAAPVRQAPCQIPFAVH